MSSREYKEQVLAAVPIESYIGRYVALKRAGKRLTGLCPFHGEKTPSFSVTPDKGLFYCFGCGKGGDLLRFVMDYDGVAFPEALETLGRFAGIERPQNFGSGKNDPRERLFQLNERVARVFTQFLHSDGGREQLGYLVSRGLSAETIATFGLGASPDAWDWLREKFGENEQELLDLGLLKAGQQEGRPPYDFFRHRVIFPIRDGGGRYVAFGGRALPGAEKQAKYINSPESKAFHKSRVLYGLYQALGEIRAKGECLLVEGYMDVIGLHQAGVRIACAPLGTALTADHLRLIARYTSRLTCIFDGDRAGRGAALRFARLSLEQGGLLAGVLLLPAGQDPFDLALQLPAPRLEALLEPGLRIPAERFYLLEIMFPGHFAENVAEQRHAAPLEYATLAREYYTGQMPAALPQGTAKRPGLDRLFEELGGLTRDSDRLLLVEEAAHLLGLDANEVRREWKRSPAARAKVTPPAYPAGARTTPSHGSSQERSTRSAMPDRRDSGPESDPESFRPVQNSPDEWESTADPGAGADRSSGATRASGFPAAGVDAGSARPGPRALRPVRPLTPAASLVGRIAACERALILELFFAPAMIGEYQGTLAELEFSDPHAEFLWRYLETRYLTGNIWTLDDLGRFDLPEESMQVFSALVLQKLEATGPSRAEALHDEDRARDWSRLQQTVLRDLLLEHRILALKKRIADIGSRYVVADSVDKSYLIHENGRLVKELKELELQRRNSGQPVP